MPGFLLETGGDWKVQIRPRNASRSWRRRLLAYHEQRQQRREAERGRDYRHAASHAVDQETKYQGSRRLRLPRRSPDDAEAIAVVYGTEDRQRQGAARDGQDAVAGAMKDRERACGAATGQRENGSADRMRQAPKPGRQHRTIAPEKPCFPPTA